MEFSSLPVDGGDDGSWGPKLLTALGELKAGVDSSVAKAGNSVTIGDGAMAAMTAYNHTVAIGRGALANGTKSRDNIGIGDSALKNVSAGDADYNQADLSGTRNVAMSGNALYFLTSGYSNVAIGRNAASCLQSGAGLVAVGANANGGYAPIGFTGAVENWAAWGTPGMTIRTVAIGSNALNANTSPNNVAIGGDALTANKKSDNNVAVGARALASLDSGTGYNGGLYVALSVSGTYAQSGTVLTLTFTAHGLVVGDIAYVRLLDGVAQTFGTDVALAYVVSAPTANTFTVAYPVSQTASGTASLLGKETAAQQGTNGGNVAIGSGVADVMTTGGNNVMVGADALDVATTASQTVAVGRQAFAAAPSASNCVGIGYFAAGSMTGAGDKVTAVGASALRSAVDGTALTASWSNISGLGYDTRVSGANQVQLGNTAATVYVQAAVQTRSDARDKADVKDTALGLSFIEALRPVDYRWDRREDYAPRDPETGEVVHLERDGSKKRSRFHHGLIAQEVAEVIAETGVDFGGFQDHKVAGGCDVLSIGYEELIAPLIKAVQELSAEVKALKAERG